MYYQKYLKYKNKYLNLKKQLGSGASLEEIIDELKSKGKYDEWVRLGAKFGLTSDTLKAN